MYEKELRINQFKTTMPLPFNSLICYLYIVCGGARTHTF